MPVHDAYNSPTVQLFSELLNVGAPPGWEQAMAALLAGKIAAMGLPCERDAAGNLLVRFGPRGDSTTAGKLLLAAHMDEIALAVARIQPSGRLEVIRSGALTPSKSGERVYDILGDKTIVKGITSCGTGHAASTAGAPVQATDWSSYWVTTGLTPSQLEEAGVHPGSPMVPCRDGRGPYIFGDPDDPMLAGWTFDDRMGIVALLRLLEDLAGNPVEFSHPLIIAFTVEEEAGCHGAKFLCQREQPDCFIAIDGCPVVRDCDLVLDGRPAIWAKDELTNYSLALNQAICSAARDAAVGLQYAILTSAKSDASAAYNVGGVANVAVFGHVRENSHGFEVARLSVFDNTFKVLRTFVRDLDRYLYAET